MSTAIGASTHQKGTAMTKILALIIVLAATSVSAGQNAFICGHYWSGAHQNWIEGANHAEADLANLDRGYEGLIGKCVCAYGVIKNGAFTKLRAIVITQCAHEKRRTNKERAICEARNARAGLSDSDVCESD